MNPLQFFTEKIIHEKLWTKEITISRNDYLAIEGSLDTNLYLVEEGSLRIYIIDDLEEYTIRFGYKGNIISVLDCFITEQPSELYIQALKKTVLKSIPKSDFMNLVYRSKKHLLIWEQLLGQLIYQQLERERDLLTATPLKRYQRVLKRSPHLFQEIPHKHIASYLRMTPETLSRIKKS